MNWELHEGYQKLDRAVYNDIGLIYLVDGHRTVPPVKLDFNNKLRPGDDVAVIGFGTDGGDSLSETLHVLHTDVTSYEYCRNTFGIIVEKDKHFCTGILNEAKAACQGDSGGPAIQTSGGSDVQVGIVSAGAPKCSTSLTVYTRVSAYKDWLKARVCGRRYPPDWCHEEGALDGIFANLNGETQNGQQDTRISTGCFSGSSIVKVKGTGDTLMADLDIGDMVHVGNNVYEPIYSFGHRVQTARVNMLQVKTNASAIRLTPDHLLYTYPNGPLRASQITIGDLVLDGESKVAIVESVQNITEYGLFNPFTPSGRIVVNNMLSSNYIAFGHKNALHLGKLALNYHLLAHAAVAPLRIACYHMGTCKDETYSEDGILRSLTVPLVSIQW
eukprot:CAMPEP_0178899412 /NCGR_PEP_ID=MMETSP0786-20121207/2886_1 /TAXON_ID=186022 /ORGANISM="Thalassionema frauenfeldii, Strain CCMP 1798" /LENGTH=385 /DNA_ID=CAMNT_0020570267 /DNA_START=427 /DNA_END=1581 /DNA_ORIENTATION=+